MAGLIHSWVGEPSLKQSLLSSLERGQWPASFIFQGVQGVGKHTLARALLQVANCQQESLACGQCSHCLRSLEEKNEMVMELKPEGKKIIAVDQVRDIQSQLSLAMPGELRRFVIIDPADKLSVPAANALLKVLEEPPSRTHFFLITNRVSRLLPTLRSRSQVWTFQPLSQEQLSSLGDMNELALTWSGGRVESARELQTEDGAKHLQESLSFLYKLVCSEPQDWKKEAPWFFNDEFRRERSFEHWSLALRNCLRGQAKGLEFLAQRPQHLPVIFESLMDLQKDLERHVDKQLALDHFSYQVKG